MMHVLKVELDELLGELLLQLGELLLQLAELLLALLNIPPECNTSEISAE